MSSGTRPRGPLAVSALCAVVALASTACTASTTEKSVTFTGTGGNMSTALRTTTFDPFTKREGIKVLEDSPNNEAKLKAMVEAGSPTWDVYYTSPYKAIKLCGTLFEKVDYSKIDKSQLPADQVSECGVPFMKSAFVLVYNKAKYGDAPPKSWADFFDTAAFPGKRGIMNYAKDAGMEVALLGDGVKPDQLYPLDYDRAFRKLDTIRKDTVFFTTGAQQQQALESGQVDMMLAWPGRAYDAKKNGGDLGVVWNQALHYTDVLTVVKGAKHPAEASALIGAMVGKEGQQGLAEHLPYTPMNTAAQPKPTELLKEFMPSYNENGTELVRDNTWWAENFDEATEKWTAWVNS